ncbi:alpha-ribazole phosphatase [Thermoflexales bacterium]|nr:alpha-ribazole phosphatase [Thermoflexales bacterium]
MTTLILIRHGHTDWADKKLAGWLPDVHLSDQGKQQAEELPQRLAALNITAIYSSPLERTLETAQPLAKARGLRIHKVADLGEVKFGEWQGQTLKVLSHKKEWKIVQAAPSTFQFPDGESFRETQSRAVGAIEKIVAGHAQDTVVAFSHGDVIKLIVAYYSGIALDNFQRIAISPASISVIELGPVGARLGRLNDTGPLQNHQQPKK